jgi:hypothetical protein
MQILPHFEFGWPLLVFCLFTLFICVNLFFTLFVYGRFAFFKQKKKASEINYPPLSVILAARNESDNLYENLPIILEQDYSEFEVIIKEIREFKFLISIPKTGVSISPPPT